jgi:hypothetical protein
VGAQVIEPPTTSSDRIRHNGGTFAVWILVAVLGWMTVQAAREGSLWTTLLLAALTLGLAVRPRLDPEARRSPPKPATLRGTILGMLTWLGVATLLAFPDVMLLGQPVRLPLHPIQLGFFLAFGLPAVAFAHVHMRSDIGALRKGKIQSGLHELGPIAAIVYFLTDRGDRDHGDEGPAPR